MLFLGGFIAALVVVPAIAAAYRRWGPGSSLWIPRRLQRFFGEKDPAGLQVRQRAFPAHVAPDVKAGLDAWFARRNASPTVTGVPIANAYFENTSISAMLAPTCAFQATAVEYQAFDVGDDQTVECPQHALWMLTANGVRLAVFWTSTVTHARGCMTTRLKIEVAYRLDSDGAALAEELLAQLEQSVQQANTYRGKVLSLEERDDYEGFQGGITVHRLRKVYREDVVLADATVTLLERNLVRFVEQRAALRRLGMPTKKGLLLYGPPGTGKTHTIHYLINALPGHTTLLVTAEQLGRLSEYMTLARLLQPCLLVMEDVDLIAKQRDEADLCQQSLLNRLLNEMDGLKEDADILFLLTTNRPQILEAALAARPGRIDQAVEFPLPDAECREQLVRLYACGVRIAPDVVGETVRATEGVSASFIKELMRRSLQFHLECRPEAADPEILRNDVDQALDELLWSSGQLNRYLLGAGDIRDDK
jgi:hypothetical protein